jgi:hypothetical protein
MMGTDSGSRGDVDGPVCPIGRRGRDLANQGQVGARCKAAIGSCLSAIRLLILTVVYVEYGPASRFAFSFLFLAKLMVVCRAPSSNNRKPIPRVRCDRTALREREIGENLTERALYGIKQGRQFSTLYGTSEVGKF